MGKGKGGNRISIGDGVLGITRIVMALSSLTIKKRQPVRQTKKVSITVKRGDILAEEERVEIVSIRCINLVFIF